MQWILHPHTGDARKPFDVMTRVDDTRESGHSCGGTGHPPTSFMNDLIFVSLENWDAIWRRNQFVVAELARRHSDSKILFVGLSRDVSNDLRHGRLAAMREPAIRGVDGFENVTVLRPFKLLPNTIGAARKVNEAMFRASVRGAASKLGLRKPLLWLNPHYAIHMVGKMGEIGAVYDITDDWITLTQSPRLTELTRRQDAELCRRADAVIVCSERLRDMKRGMARQLHLIPNGVDAAHYRAVLDGNGPFPDVARGWRRPVLGYTGSVHPDRVDVGLVEAVARRMPEATIALIGPDFLPAADKQRLAACENVVLAGPVPYRAIPGHMRAFDVCITPHRVTEFTESLNPIKLWEYLASGKPIVSTDVAGFRDYRQFVRIARTADEFVAAVGEALSEPPDLAEARRREAARHSWQARVDQIERVMRDATMSSEGSRPERANL